MCTWFSASWRRFRYDRKCLFSCIYNPQITISPTPLFSANFNGNRVKNHPKPRTCPLKFSVFKALTFRDLTSFVVFPGFLKCNAKEITKWSEMSLSTTQRSSTSTSLLVMSQCSVWPRLWVGTLTSCCKLRLCSSFFSFFLQVSNRTIGVRVKMIIYVAKNKKSEARNVRLK